MISQCSSGTPKWKWKSLSGVHLFVTPYSAWNSPGQNSGVGSLSLLQGNLPKQGLSPGLPHCRRILYQLSHKGSPGTPRGDPYGTHMGLWISLAEFGFCCVRTISFFCCSYLLATLSCLLDMATPTPAGTQRVPPDHCFHLSPQISTVSWSIKARLPILKEGQRKINFVMQNRVMILLWCLQTKVTSPVASYTSYYTLWLPRNMPILFPRERRQASTQQDLQRALPLSAYWVPPRAWVVDK